MKTKFTEKEKQFINRMKRAHNLNWGQIRELKKVIESKEISVELTSKTLYTAFRWGITPQGHNYWGQSAAHQKENKDSYQTLKKAIPSILILLLVIFLMVAGESIVDHLLNWLLCR